MFEKFIELQWLFEYYFIIREIILQSSTLDYSIYSTVQKIRRITCIIAI